MTETTKPDKQTIRSYPRLHYADIDSHGVLIVPSPYLDQYLTYHNAMHEKDYESAYSLASRFISNYQSIPPVEGGSYGYWMSELARISRKSKNFHKAKESYSQAAAYYQSVIENFIDFAPILCQSLASEVRHLQFLAEHANDGCWDGGKVESISGHVDTSEIELQSSYFSAGSHSKYEVASIKYLEDQGYDVDYAENGLWSFLYTLLIQDDFLEPFFDKSNHPYLPETIADSQLYAYPLVIEDKLRKINEGDLFNTVLKKWEKLKPFLRTANIQGVTCYFLGSLSSPTHMSYAVSHNPSDYLNSQGTKNFLQKLDPATLRNILVHRLLQTSPHKTGLPDLIVSKNNQAGLVEVKRKGERLRDSQVAWMMYFSANCSPVKILVAKKCRA